MPSGESQPESIIFKHTPQGALRLHVFRPAAKPSCAMIFFMCGGWNGFHAPKHYPQASYLAERGALAAVAEVRTIERHGCTPRECVIDAKSALRFLRAHAEKTGFPATRLVAAGGSAAGHVSLACAMIDGCDDPDDDTAISAQPDLVCAYNPAVLPTIEETCTGAERLQQRLDKFGGEDAMLALSPMRAIRPGLPPVLLLHGDQDAITPLADTRLFHERMRAAGNDCRLVVYPDADHGFFNYRPDGNPFFTQTTTELDRFLSGHGFLDGAAAIDTFRYAGEY